MIQFFNDGTDRTAGTAPFRPEINHAEFVGIQHFLLKIAICQFFGHGYVCLNDEYTMIETKFSPNGSFCGSVALS